MTAEELKQRIKGLSFIPDLSITLVKLGTVNGVAYNELLNKALYMFEQGQLARDGYFFYTISDFERKTGIKERTQQRTFKDLEARGLIKVKHCGSPKRRYIKVVMDNDIISELLEMPEVNPSQIK